MQIQATNALASKANNQYLSDAFAIRANIFSFIIISPPKHLPAKCWCFRWCWSAWLQLHWRSQWWWPSQHHQWSKQCKWWRSDHQWSPVETSFHRRTEIITQPRYVNLNNQSGTGRVHSTPLYHGRISIEVYIWSLMSLSWVLKREKTILLAWASKGVDLGLNSQFCWAAAQLFLPGWCLGFTCPNNALFPGWFQHKHTLVYQA